MSPVDCATTPTGGTSATLKDWLWDNYRIFVLLLPARTSEYNPIELVWNIWAQQWHMFSLRKVAEMGSPLSLCVRHTNDTEQHITQ